MIPGSANPLLLASATGAAPSYQIERSLRFNSSDSAFLSRTPSVAGNRKTWTWAGWVKRSGLGQTILFDARQDSNNATAILFDGANRLSYAEFPGALTYNVITSSVYRDVSAWMHVCFALNTDEAVPSNRVKICVNGQQVNSFDVTLYPAQSYIGSFVNSTSPHALGAYGDGSAGFSNAYLADIHFIDGQALDPTSFGYTDANGVWQPKAYTGTYGTNGFHLDFADNSAASTAGIGKDVSGNGNDWTPNNLSVAAGAGNDSLVDTPTSYGVDTGAGGEVRGNYATLNPLDNGGLTLANGNLDSSRNTTSWLGCRSTHGITSGKWYWEYTSVTRTAAQVGIATAAGTITNYAGISANAYVFDTQDGSKWSNGSSAGYFGSASANGAIHGIAFDADNRTITFYRGGTTPGVAYSSIPTGTYFPVVSQYGTDAGVINFGQRPFAYPAPSGFKALCTTNLPEPQTITTSGSYTGNGVADGPFVYLNGVPTAMTVNGNAVTFGTHADKLSNGFKVRTTSTTYNQNAATYNYSITSTGDPFKVARAQSNP